jgi:hypothetical protein
MVNVLVVSSLGLVALVAGIYSAWQAWYAFASCRWPAVPGRVLMAGVEVANGFPSGFWPRVRYQYIVNGITFESTRLRFGGGNPFSAADAASDLRPEILACRASVYYDPHHPKRSCLIPGSNEFTLALPAIMFVLGFGIIFAVGYSLLHEVAVY